MCEHCSPWFVCLIFCAAVENGRRKCHIEHSRSQKLDQTFVLTSYRNVLPSLTPVVRKYNPMVGFISGSSLSKQLGHILFLPTSKVYRKITLPCKVTATWKACPFFRHPRIWWFECAPKVRVKLTQPWQQGYNAGYCHKPTILRDAYEVRFVQILFTLNTYLFTPKWLQMIYAEYNLFTPNANYLCRMQMIYAEYKLFTPNAN